MQNCELWRDTDVTLRNDGSAVRVAPFQTSMLIRTRAWHLFRFGRLTRSLVTAQKAFHNKLYFFRALLTHLYLLSFALSEDFLFRADVIYPIQFFLHVIGIPAWALPVPYAVACSGGSVGIRIQQRACSGYYIFLALCGSTLLAVVVIGFAIARGMSNVHVAIGMAKRTGTTDPVGRCRVGQHRSRSIDHAASAPTATYGAGRIGLVLSGNPGFPWATISLRFFLGLMKTFWLTYIRVFLVPRLLCRRPSRRAAGVGGMQRSFCPPNK